MSDEQFAAAFCARVLREVESLALQLQSQHRIPSIFLGVPRVYLFPVYVETRKPEHRRENDFERDMVAHGEMLVKVGKTLIDRYSPAAEARHS